MLFSESVSKGSIQSHITFDFVACILYVGLVLLIDFSRPGMMALLLLEIPHAINWMMLFWGSKLKLCENIGCTNIVFCLIMTLLLSIQLGCDVVATLFRMQYLVLCDTLTGRVTITAMDLTFGIDYTCEGGHWWLELLIAIFQVIVVLSSIKSDAVMQELIDRTKKEKLVKSCELMK